MKYLNQFDIKESVESNIFQYLNFLFWRYSYTYQDAVKAGYKKYIKRR